MRTADLAALREIVASPQPGGGARDLASYITAGLRREPSKPFITFYDDATGERVELSYATFANWVWKSANYLHDGLGVTAGDRVGMLLPTHWQTTAVWYAAWAAGAEVVPLTPGALTGGDVAAVFAHEPQLPEVLAARLAPGAVVGLSLRPMAGKLQATPPGVEDYSAEVPGYGDLFAPSVRPPLDAPALDGRSAASLLGGAAAAAAHLGLTPADRVLVDGDIDGADAFVATICAVFDAGAGIVLCRRADPARLERRSADERVTVVIATRD